LCPKRWLGITPGPSIDEWIAFYAQGPGRRYLEKAIERSTPYIESMEKIIREEGLPSEVLSLVYIESGFDMSAVSYMRAAGPWQFMRRTAGRFGLRVGKYVDERRDPELSTRAAVQYLKYLYGLFDSWTLAAASYNSGEGRVLRAMKSQNTRDFWSLELPKQTREFIPKVAAVLTILSDPGRYGFETPRPKALHYDVVEVNGPVRLAAIASVCGSSEADLEILNPALLRGMTPPGSDSFRLRVPYGTGDICKEELSKIRYHMVSRGETLSQIADRYDVSISSIARANAVSDPHRIRQGMLLTIPPVLVSRTAAKAGAVLAAAAGRAADMVHYTVVPGDSLWRISAKFGTSVAQLARWNGLGNSTRIKPGQVLKVFVAEG
jgi:membrane-bound lytic murein transglycosylase D